MALHHRWFIMLMGVPHCWLSIYGTLSSMGLPLWCHWWHFIINSASSSMAHHLWHFIIDGSSSVALHHRWGIIINRASWSMGFPHPWGFLIALVAYHKFVLTFPCTSALNPTLQLQQQNWTNHEVPSSKMSLATIIFRWHSQKIIYISNIILPCFWRSKICEKFGQSKTKLLLQNY